MPHHVARAVGHAPPYSERSCPMRRLLLVPLLALPIACDQSSSSSNKPTPAESTDVSPSKVEQILAQMKRPDGAPTPADGIAVTILVDTSGSMDESVNDAG